MPLGNWVILESGTPERMHFSNFVKEVRDITDPHTLQVTKRNVGVFDVDRLNGQPVVAKFSVMAEKLYAKLEPYLKDNQYRGYDFIITKTGEGYLTSFSVQVIPLIPKG